MEYKEQLALFRAMRPVELLERLILGEAESEPFKGKFAVGCAVRNRVQIPRWWGFDYMGVMLKPFQFSCFNEEQQYLLIPRMLNPPKTRAWDDCQFAARLVMEGVPDVTAGANHYHTVSRPRGADKWPPEWAARMTKTCIIHNHVFYDDLGVA